jgi:hypothetical protein
MPDIFGRGDSSGVYVHAPHVFTRLLDENVGDHSVLLATVYPQLIIAAANGFV